MEFDAAVMLVRHTLRHLQLLDVQALQQACSALSTAVKLYMEQDRPVVWAQIVRNSPLPAGHPLQAVEPASDIPRVVKSLARMHRGLQTGSLSHVSQHLLGHVHEPLGPEAINPQGTAMISRRADCLCILDVTQVPDLREVGCLLLPEDQRGRWEAVTWAPDGSAVCVFFRTVEGAWGPHDRPKWRGVLCLIPIADPRLVVIHDPEFPWSEAPLTFTRDSQHLVMPALDAGCASMQFAEMDNFLTFNRKGRKVAMLYDQVVYSGGRGASLAHTVSNRVVVACWDYFQSFDVTTWDTQTSCCCLEDSDGCGINTCCMGLVAANPAGTLVACMVKGWSSFDIIDAISLEPMGCVTCTDLDHVSRGMGNNLAWVLHGWLLSTTLTSFPPGFESVHVIGAPKKSSGSQSCMQTLQYQWPNGTMPAVSPDGRYFARLTQDTRAVDIFDIPTGHLLLTQKVEVSRGMQVLDRPATSALLWSRDGGSLLVRQPARQVLSLSDGKRHAGNSVVQLLVMRF